MKKRIVLIALVFVSVIVAAAFLMGRLSSKPEEGVLLLSGNVEVTEMNVGFKLAGRVTGLSVEEGQRVSRDDRLATLDSAELESAVAQSKASLSEARVKLAELRAGSRVQEIEQSQANVKSAEAEAEKAQKDYVRAERLYGKGAIATAQFDAAKSTYETRVAQHRSAMEQASLVREGPRREELEAAEKRVQQAGGAVGVSEARLRDTVIYAPASGVILRKNIELGETVGSGTPVYTIGDLEHPWIKVYVRETDLGLVKLGQKAVVTTDSFPGKSYEGAVTFISSEAEFTPKNVQTREERVKLVFGVKVSVKNRSDELKPGMPADVKILLR